MVTSVSLVPHKEGPLTASTKRGPPTASFWLDPVGAGRGARWSRKSRLGRNWGSPSRRTWTTGTTLPGTSKSRSAGRPGTCKLYQPSGTMESRRYTCTRRKWRCRTDFRPRVSCRLLTRRRTPRLRLSSISVVIWWWNNYKYKVKLFRTKKNFNETVKPKVQLFC